MLYKFQSRAAPDLLMLQVHGQHLLMLIGKHNEERRGVLRPAEMPAAIFTLEAAMADEKAEEAALKAAEASRDDADEKDATEQDEPPISLRQRAAPFIEMLHRCLAENADVIWGI